MSSLSSSLYTLMVWCCSIRSLSLMSRESQLFFYWLMFFSCCFLDQVSLFSFCLLVSGVLLPYKPVARNVPAAVRSYTDRSLFNNTC